MGAGTTGAAARRALAAGIFDAAVARAHPATCLPAHLPPPPAIGRILVLATGKAGASLAAAAAAHYATAGVARERIGGLAVCRHGYAADAGPIRVVEAGHPVPDEAGVAATRETLRLAREAGPDDLVLALISGGGSANWIAPAGDLTLADKQAVTKALLRCGASIGEINCVRKRLSLIKGGRLAALAAPARIEAFAISDVPGDDPATIASGPTVPDPTTSADARAVVAKYGLALPDAARRLLEDPANETPKPGDACFARTRFTVIARPAEAIEAAARAARAAGYEPIVLGADVEGEAREVARAHAARARAEKAAGRRVAILSGGELTVTIRGGGRGGPNQEYALALALALAETPGIAALAGDTDGTDGGSGASSDPAGAYVDETTLARARAKGLDAARFLDENDSTAFFEALSDLHAPGPTRTNVNDCRVILVD
ncbi:glycerate kinase type-2 family protein [Salinarimonas sp. NSM]|uniref:glycerate kinase type-2 family protein n=1 Tax=Salinarimonas sp. NSM TaxID=3458003 RepID=UPI004036C7A7